MRLRILRTLLTYSIVIIIPTTILLIQGYNAIQLQKEQIEINFLSDLNRVKGQILQDLHNQWSWFREQELNRSFYEYQPITPSDPALVFSRTRAHQRSPLQLRPHNLNIVARAMDPTASDSPLPTTEVGKDLDRIFENALVGYFQYDPALDKMSTPYDEPNLSRERWNIPILPTKDKNVATYHTMLSNYVAQEIKNQTRVFPNKMDARSILVKLKTKRIKKFEEPAQRIREMTRLNYPEMELSQLQLGTDLVEVSYYDFIVFYFSVGEEQFIGLVRLVLQSERILFQGFILSSFLFRQEAQSYIEQFQPDYGNMLVSDTGSGDPLFGPFQGIQLVFQPGEESQARINYRAERNRFWFTVVFLLLALIGSMAHMARLINAEHQLVSKKKDFVSAVTHELKAPLTSIRMYSEMLEEGWAKGKEKLYYHYIHSETNRLARLVQNILDFARIERGEFNLTPKNIEMATLCEEAVKSWSIWMEENGMKIRCTHTANPTIHADEDSLKQVLYNLCDNSLKYGSGGEDPCLTMNVSETESQAILVVYDNGSGVPKEDEDRIFERFYRCGNELTREQTGTGLGLALVKEIVEANGGQIRLHPAFKLQGFAVELSFPKVFD